MKDFVTIIHAEGSQFLFQVNFDLLRGKKKVTYGIVRITPKTFPWTQIKKKGSVLIAIDQCNTITSLIKYGFAIRSFCRCFTIGIIDAKI